VDRSEAGEAEAVAAAADRAKLAAAAAQPWKNVGNPEQAVALGNTVALLMERPVAASRAAAAASAQPDKQPVGRAPAAEVSRAGGGQRPTRRGRDKQPVGRAPAAELSTAELDTMIAEVQQQDAYKAAARRAPVSVPSDSRKTSSSRSRSTSDEGSEESSDESSDEAGDEDSDSPEQRSDNKADHSKGKRARAHDVVLVQDRPQLTTMTVSALGRCLDRAWLPVIELAADRVSYVAHHVLLFANLHIARELARPRGAAPVVDRAFLTKIRWLFVTGRPTVHDPRPNMQATLRELELRLGREIEPVPGVGLSHILDAAIDELEVACSNYDKFALASHVAKYVRALYRLERSAGASAFAGKVLRPHGPPGRFVKLPDSLARTGVSLAEWNRRIETMHARYVQCLDADRRPRGPQLAAWRREMIAAIGAANDWRATMVNNIADPALRAAQDWRYRSFTLIPLRSQGRKFISISNAAMKQLYALAKDMAYSERRDAAFAAAAGAGAAAGAAAASHTVEQVHAAQNLFRHGIDSFFNRGAKAITRENKRWRCKEDGELVAASHKVGRRLHGKGKKSKTSKTAKLKIQALGINMDEWDFADMVRTNGIELHIVFRSRDWPGNLQGRPVPERQLPPELRTATTDLDPPHLARALVQERADGLGGLPRWTASDPGVKSPMTTAIFDAGTNQFVSKTFSGRRYRALAGRAALPARVARDREEFQLDPLIAEYAQHPLTGCYEANALLEATAVRFRRHQAMHDGHSSRGKLKLGFLTKRRVASAIDKVVNFIRHDKTVELVAIGDRSRTFGLRGASQGAPIVKIERRALVRGRNEGFQVFLVNEHCTSRKSWCCKGEQMKGIRTGNKLRTLPDGTQVAGTTNGILACQGCRKLWGRDPNASFNIGECVFAELHGLPRPAHLRSSAQGFE
jgi:hypothetical protein